MMEILLATVGARKAAKSAAAGEMLAEYLARIGHLSTPTRRNRAPGAPNLGACRAESYATEERLLAAVASGKRGGGGRDGRIPELVMLDRRGRGFSTEEFAAWLGRQRELGMGRLVFAVGPADGWSEEARGRAGMLLSLGPMTLPHELAAVVLAEQVYRAFTILEGHPYHLGHAGEPRVRDQK